MCMHMKGHTHDKSESEKNLREHVDERKVRRAKLQNEGTVGGGEKSATAAM